MNSLPPTSVIVYHPAGDDALAHFVAALPLAELAGRLNSARFPTVLRASGPGELAACLATGMEHALVVPLLPLSVAESARVEAAILQAVDAAPARVIELAAALLGELTAVGAFGSLLVRHGASACPELPTLGAAIESRSQEIIDAHFSAEWRQQPEHDVIQRVVHATANVEFADWLRIHPDAVACGIRAIQAGAPVICDTRMLQAGLTRMAGQVHCVIADEATRELAQTANVTRSAAAMMRLAPLFDGAIIVIGNAPTALTKVLELVADGAARPALVVGLPIGFVGAHEAKQALINSDLCYISNIGPAGGSPAAAAAVNALAILAKKVNP